MSGTSSRDEPSRAPSPSVEVAAAGGECGVKNGGEGGGNIIIPYPVSVSLRNQFVRDHPPQPHGRRGGGGGVRTPLLLPTVLEIYSEVDTGGDGPGGCDGDSLVKGTLETDDDAARIRDEGADAPKDAAADDEDAAAGSVLYRADHLPALNPRWDDLGDVIDGGGEGGGGCGPDPLSSLLLSGSDRDAYKRVRVRVRAERVQRQLEEDEDDRDGDGEHDEEGEEGDAGHDEVEARSPDAQIERSPQQQLRVTLADLPLYPGALRRLPGRHRHHPQGGGSGAVAAADFSDPTVPPPPHHRFIPALPPNALLVEYSDGYTRVDPTVYDVLVSAGVVVPSHHQSEDAVGRDADDGGKVEGKTDDDDDEDGSGDDQLERDYAEEQERLAVRFSDDAFDALLPPSGSGSGPKGDGDGGVVPVPVPSLCDEVDVGVGVGGGEPDLVWNPCGREESPASSTNDGPISGRGVWAVPPATTLDDENDRGVAVDGGHYGGGCAAEVEAEEGDIQVPTSAESLETAKDTEKIRGIRLREEVRRLESILASEENAVESSLRSADREASTLRRIVDETVRLEGEVDADVNSIKIECDRLASSHFVLETRRAKLLGELRRIYPIQCLRSPPSPGGSGVEGEDDRRYAIRGLEVPRDLGGGHGLGMTSHHHHHHSAAAYDDAHLSSALGFVCHLVFMCSKYLGIPLRYRLICNSSRSAVAVPSSSPPPVHRSNDGAEVTGSKGVESDNDGTSAPSSLNSSSQAAAGFVCYPLFRDGGVAPELFGRAVVLLERDIECLLRKRGIPYVPRSHMLAKLDRLFEQTIRGGGGGGGVGRGGGVGGVIVGS